MDIINFSETNSLVSQYVKEMRDVNVQGDRLRFRNNVKRIGQIIAYEVSKRLNYAIEPTTTPLGIANSHVIDDKLVLGTIMRAGLPFHEGFLSYFDYAENAFVSAYRKYKEKNHDDFDVFIEYIASPNIEGKTLILVDPMLATGSSMLLSYKALLTKGTPAHIHVASIIASQAAIDFVKEHFPADRTTLWVADVDPEINEHSYIVPGLGDAGDLTYGEKE